MAQQLRNFIRDHGVKELENRFAVTAKRHGVYDNLVLFKYNQIDSPMNSPIVQQARGIILDEANDWAVVSYPYDKFFNYGESNAADLDWGSARVYEKLDGSLMTLYHYDNKWHVSSSGMPDAAGNVLNSELSFADLFWKVWEQLEYDLPDNKNMCYMFELMTPYNRVVVKHARNRIVLHGARNLSDFSEVNPIVVAHHNGWECVEIHSLETWEDIMEASKKLDPLESEGFVVADGNYNRVKVKTPQYVALSRFKDKMSTVPAREILKVMLDNENEEFSSYLEDYPEYASLYAEVRGKFDYTRGIIEGMYEMVKDIDDKKQFAMKVKDSKYSGALFSLKHGKVQSVRQYLAEMNIKALEDWLDINHVDII